MRVNATGNQGRGYAHVHRPEAYPRWARLPGPGSVLPSGTLVIALSASAVNDSEERNDGDQRGSSAKARFGIALEYGT